MRATRPTAEHTRPIIQLGYDRASRHHLNNLNELAASMALEGLRHPVLITPSGQLLKGARRVAAARLLGWTDIQTKEVSTVEDAVEAITVQKDETSRDRTATERVELGLTIELLDRRQPRPARGQPGYEIHPLIGSAIYRSGATYRRARGLYLVAHSQEHPAHVVDVARVALAEAEAGTITITGAYDKMRAAEKADPLNGLGADGLPLIAAPQGNARTAKARKLRLTWIRALAAKGATSADIAAHLGISNGGLRKIANDAGIVVPADEALRKTQRRAADPNRAMRVAVDDLDALVWSLDKTDPAVLDPIEAARWAEKLKEYARAIDRVARKIAKEHVR